MTLKSNFAFVCLFRLSLFLQRAHTHTHHQRCILHAKYNIFPIAIQPSSRLGARDWVVVAIYVYLALFCCVFFCMSFSPFAFLPVSLSLSILHGLVWKYMSGKWFTLSFFCCVCTVRLGKHFVISSSCLLLSATAVNTRPSSARDFNPIVSLAGRRVLSFPLSSPASKCM